MHNTGHVRVHLEGKGAMRHSLGRQDEAARLTLAISDEKSSVSAIVENGVSSLARNQTVVVTHCGRRLPCSRKLCTASALPDSRENLL